MSNSSTVKHAISTDYPLKLMDNILDIVINRNFAGNKLSVVKDMYGGLASAILEKYDKIYSALESWNIKFDQSKIAKDCQSKMRDLIIQFGEASDDDLKKMVSAAFRKSPEMKKEVGIALNDASLRLKRFKEIEDVVKTHLHISLVDKIKEEINLKNAYESFFKEQNLSKLQGIMNTVKQTNLKNGVKKVLQLYTCAVKLDRQLNEKEQYSKEQIMKFTEWQRKLVVPVLELKSNLWFKKSYEQHFCFIGSVLCLLTKGETVDLTQGKNMIKDNEIGTSLNTLSKQVKQSVQKSKQIYYQITEMINTYKCQNDINLANSSIVDDQKISSKVMEVILNYRLKQLEKIIRTLFEFGIQAKEAFLQSNENTKMTESSLKETDLKSIVEFIKKKSQKKEGNLYSSRSYPSSIIIKEVNQNSSLNENSNEELSQLRQAYIDICQLIIPENSEGSQNINELCRYYRQRNHEIVKRINKLNESQTQATQLANAREELEKEIGLKKLAETKVQQIEKKLNQQIEKLESIYKQKQTEFSNILSQKEGQIDKMKGRETQQQRLIDQLKEQMFILQRQQTSKNEDTAQLREFSQILSAAQQKIAQANNSIQSRDVEITKLTNQIQQLKLQILHKEQTISQRNQKITQIQRQKADIQAKAVSQIAETVQKHKKQKSQLNKSHKIFIDNLSDKYNREKDQLIINMNASSEDIQALLQKHQEEKKGLNLLHKQQINKKNQSLELLGRQKAEREQQISNRIAEMKRSKQQWETEKLRMFSLSSMELQRQRSQAEAKYQEYLKDIKDKEDLIQNISGQVAERDRQLSTFAQRLSRVEQQLANKVKELSNAETSLKKRIGQLQDSAKANKQTDGEEKSKIEAQLQAYRQELSTQQMKIKQSETFISNLKKDHEDEIIKVKSNHKDQLEIVNTQIKQLGEQIKKKDKALDNANILVREREKKVKELQESIKEKQKKIKEHQIEVTESEDKYLTLFQENANVKMQLEEAEIKIQKLEKDKANLANGQAKEKQNEVKQLNQLLARERTSFKALQSKLEEERKLSKSWQQKLAAAESELKKKPSVSSQLLIRNKQLKQLDERIQKRKQDVVFIESAEARSEKYNQLARQYSLCPLFIAFINSLFYGEILDEEFEMKVRLVRHVEGLMKTPIKAAKMIFKYDSLNPTNFHKYIDDHRNLVCVVKLSNGTFIATFYSGVYSRGEPLISPSLIMSLSSNESYELYNATTNSAVRTFRGMTYDDFFLIFGNAEMRIRANEKTVFSNFGIGNSFFNNRGAKVNQILGAGENREVEFQGYEIYELAFEEKQE